MANKIQVKRSAVPSKVPTTSDLDLGEIAINTYDGIAYIKKDNGTQSIVAIGAGSGDVVGPSSATDNALARFDSTTGKLIQNSVGVLSDTGSLSGLTDIQNINYVDFDTGYATTITTGQLGWDSTNNALAYGMAGGNIIQHIGEDQYLYIKASSAITKGQVIMFTGSVGASGVLTGAPATGITDGTYIMGVAAETIALNGFGFVQTFGVLKNVDTSAFADGDILWYNPSVTGGLTATKPSAPNVKAQIAACNKGGSSGGGVITIRVNPGSQLGGTDSNAQITSASNGQLLTYDGVAGYWKNTSLTAGTGISVSATAGVVTVTNSAPDQTVSLTGSGGAVITGTYPNFTITTPSGTVTSVTGTAPISSSGGATPAISISQANGSTNGYLSSTDWTTFNSKAPATSGTSILYGNGSGGFSNVTVGSGLTFSAGTLSSAGGSPGGSNTQVQYNSSGTFAGSASFTFDGTVVAAPVLEATTPFILNAKTVSSSYSIPSNYNAHSVGPVTIASGQTVTVPSNSRWVVL